jgi:choline kinase
MVLAAGAGRRLGSLTEALPKTLIPVDGERTILDVTLENLKSVGLGEVAIVTGFAADRIEERVPELQRRHGVRIELIFNPKAEIWNNAYSLWCAREALGEGALLVNGDTVVPAVVLERVLAGRGEDIVLAVDRDKPLGAEEMKVRVDDEGILERITKQMDPAEAHGEYIGVTLIEPAAATPLADALQATFERDPQLYYEDGFQEVADRGGRVGTAAIGAVDWVEIDDERDLEKARALTGRF